MDSFVSSDLLLASKGKHAVLYTIPNNAECRAAKEFLLKRGVKFEEADVTKSAAALEEMLKLSPAGRPPVLVSAGRSASGFDESKFASVLSL